MKKDQNKVLSVIALATLIITVLGASFAYFNAAVNKGSGSALTTVIDQNDVVFTASASDLNMEITADKMTQSASKDGMVEAGFNDESLIYVELIAGSENPVECTYNIYYQWDSAASAYLSKTSGATKEFTAQLILMGNTEGGKEGTNKLKNETQFTDVVTTTNKTIVVEGAKIVDSSSQEGMQIWNPVIRFYNLQQNQSALANKSFKGKFTVGDVVCAQHYEPTLSDVIIAKVSDEEYISSQDESAYYIKREFGVSAEESLLPQSEYVDILTASGQSLDNVGIYYENGVWSIPSTSSTSYNLKFKLNNKENVICIGSNGSEFGISGDVSLDIYVNSKPVFTNLYPTPYLNDGGYADYYDDNCQYVSANANDIIDLRIDAGGYDEVSGYFYVKKASVKDAGVRYEGVDPDNYITFNGGEEWRIIGVFEGSTIGLEPGKQYTKIMSSNLTETWVYINPAEDACVDDWDQDKITFLDNIFEQDKIAIYNNEYSKWYLLGSENFGASAGDWYLLERFNGMPGYKDAVQYAADIETRYAIGLIYPSDYVYSNGWMRKLAEASNLGFLTITPGVDCNGKVVIGDSSVGCICGESANYAPTLYLEANLTATGTGTQEDPYVLN